MESTTDIVLNIVEIVFWIALMWIAYERGYAKGHESGEQSARGEHWDWVKDHEKELKKAGLY
jgi:hypothetical protein